MIKRLAPGLVLALLVTTPMLACGFPLPAGTTVPATAKAVCAADEAIESCNLRRDAYQLMNALNSASVTDLVVDLYIDDGVEVTEAAITGSYDYIVSETADYLGADLHAWLDQAAFATQTGADDLSNTQVIIVDDIGYTLNADGSWLKEELNASALLGLSFLFGVTGTEAASLDVFRAPETFTVTTGEPVQHMGQEMVVQTLAVDLQALLNDPDALLALFDDLAAMGLENMGIDPASIGDPNQLAAMAPILLPFFEGTAITATLWIGADDGYIHYVDESYVLELDLSALDPDTVPMAMRYNLQGYLSNHNAALTITAPENVVESEGSFDLGGNLFGN